MNIFLPINFLKDAHEGNLSLKDADDKQRNFAAKIKILMKVKINWKRVFLKII